MIKRPFQTASQRALPPVEEELFVDRLVKDNTRFNATRTHRYTLFRHWGDPKNYCAFIGMNPSGADECGHDDRTVRKCCRFSEKWGHGALYMLNAFALRATDCRELYEALDPVGRPENDRWIRTIAAAAARVVVAWGKPGGDFNRGAEVEAILREVCEPEKVLCFGHNLDALDALDITDPSTVPAVREKACPLLRLEFRGSPSPAILFIYYHFGAAEPVVIGFAAEPKCSPVPRHESNADRHCRLKARWD